jgi:hypothetical protein
METKEIKLSVTKASSICMKQGVRVYPVCVGSRYKIEVEFKDGKKKLYDKLVSEKEMHSAWRKTWIAYATKILKDQEEKQKNGNVTNS